MTDRLLVALDVDSGARAIELADALRGIAGGFKIGNRLFTAEGPRIVTALTARGDRVFLDLKFHDIPNTVAQAVAVATDLGVWMVNVHASGGGRMMRAARDAAHEAAARANRPPPMVIGVTVLTSLSDAALAETGVGTPMVDQVARLARLSQVSGLDGVVASPREIAVIRQACGEEFVIVTPGIRGGDAAAGIKDDQERTMSAGGAVRAGASYIVVGRPIIADPEPRSAALRIAGELARA